MRVSVQVCEFVEVKKSAQQRIAKCVAGKLCCACLEPLDSLRTVRGCHERCYMATRRAIKRGDTTDRETISEGFWLEEETGGRKPSNPVTIRTRGPVK